MTGHFVVNISLFSDCEKHFLSMKLFGTTFVNITNTRIKFNLT